MTKTKAKVNAKIRKVAKDLLKLFGPKGEHWISGMANDGDGNYCLIGALELKGHSTSLLDNVLPLNNLDLDDENIEIMRFDDTPEFNDRDGFKPVRSFLELLAKGIDPSTCYIDEDGSVTQLITKKIKV